MMINLSSTGVVIALAALAILVLALVVKLCAGKPKRAEKWEKAAIMKKLLELSERDEALATAAPSVRLRMANSSTGARPSNANLKTTTKATLPTRSKSR